jgi:murein L,D-transpeptidase YafK
MGHSRNILRPLILLLGLCLISSSAFSFSKEPKSRIDTIRVEKHKHIMTVLNNNKVIKSYRIALGFDPIGHKIKEGDGKTPEGTYYIVYKNPASQFHLSLKLSYPSPQDRKVAKSLGTNPGGNIMIHGVGSRFQANSKWHAMRDWTLGCIAVTNEEIEEIFRYADVGTKVEILP